MIFGKEKIAKILSRMKTQDSKKILDTISTKNIQLSNEIRELMFTFEDIMDLTTKDMQLLHKKIDTNDLLLAMKGLSDELKEKLLSGISSNKKTLLLEDFELMGKVKLSDVESSRQKIMDVIREMIETGEISLDDEWIE
ncbi:FliG C-terminal domain-containing protein [Sulfurimonas sp.]|uniref:FliG C-terminal domain-containing protein n=1 Tax=Sulfurimonas sp. TaxID=2022749 RepID=UPI0035629160